ncbi:hypothetical protein [Stigmatella aurantiaca]|uniref:Conserved uncharacterized protein n=1 Tax=Stigmatella aurantiaca (strain DW4/3-1) TaxID=378806 RepID=Q08ST4_STIAD|nr:hypothetical protein [Stigmatella aurantiaca]ADO72914.1 conserved uncharacterized protein [Stigmatella aurantiaca DW4/3-1]EAU63549.1 hypothetical protein STIAU_7195 [Stigmatella aurantiaca DW4/3-1]
MISLRLLVLGLAAASPAAPPSTAEQLHAVCQTHALEPSNPWALAHGITLEGRDVRARDGRRAVDVIVSDFLRRDEAPGGRGLYFESFTAQGHPVQPHPALLEKTLVLAGVPLGRTFRTEAGPVTLKRLMEALQRNFHPTLASSPEGAWALDALGHVLTPGATFRNGTGETVRFDAVMDEALVTLEREQSELAEGMKAGLPQVPKRKQGIYAHPCGGLHFFQAVASWARHPAVRQAWGGRLEVQVDVLLYRLGSEARQYEAALAAAPQHRLALLSQSLKFYGHFLETLGRYRKENGWRPSPSQQQTVVRARQLLEATVRRLGEAQAFQRMPVLAKEEPQLFWDLLGDSCHAAHGLDLWK